jgi:hypothetical protein
MNDRTLQDSQRKKRVYQRPELVQVPLRPEEAVLGHCKTTSTTAGPGTSGCTILSCTVAGS